jgi:hypothetical protein
LRNSTILHYSNRKRRRGGAHNERLASNIQAKQCDNVFVENYVFPIFLFYSKTLLGFHDKKDVFLQIHHDMLLPTDDGYGESLMQEMD